jgi:ribosomal protein S18 acetylase RimI-like enzyme
MMSGVSYPAEVMLNAKAYYTHERLEKVLFGSRSIALGGYINDRLVGCVWGYFSELDGIFSIEWAVVISEVIGKGVFSRLMVALEDALEEKGAFKIILYASNKNISAIRRYEKLGYTIEGVHPNHFFGWNFVSMGKILTHKTWHGEIMKQPDVAQ